MLYVEDEHDEEAAAVPAAAAAAPNCSQLCVLALDKFRLAARGHRPNAGYKIKCTSRKVIARLDLKLIRSFSQFINNYWFLYIQNVQL